MQQNSILHSLEALRAYISFARRSVARFWLWSMKEGSIFLRCSSRDDLAPYKLEREEERGVVARHFCVVIWVCQGFVVVVALFSLCIFWAGISYEKREDSLQRRRVIFIGIGEAAWCGKVGPSWGGLLILLISQKLLIFSEWCEGEKLEFSSKSITLWDSTQVFSLYEADEVC